jgi:hypothetical protein
MLARNGCGWVEQLPSVRREGGENSSLSAVQLIYFSLGLGQIKNRPTLPHAHEYASCGNVETCTDSHVLENVICEPGVVRHDNDVRVHRRFSTSVLP